MRGRSLSWGPQLPGLLKLHFKPLVVHFVAIHLLDGQLCWCRVVVADEAYSKRRKKSSLVCPPLFFASLLLCTAERLAHKTRRRATSWLLQRDNNSVIQRRCVPYYQLLQWNSLLPSSHCLYHYSYTHKLWESVTSQSHTLCLPVTWRVWCT